MLAIRMTRPSASRALAIGGAASALCLTAAGCGTGGGSTAQGSASHRPMHHAMSHHEAMTHTTATPFGSDCGMIPAAGMGSLHGMAMDPVVTAAAHNPLLTTFAAEAKKAGLTAELNSARGITVFAPENSAFAKLHGSAMTMLENPRELAVILRYHVVTGHVTPAELAAGKTVPTMQGEHVTLSKMGTVYEVNKADVICGNITTANATVYIINAVLTPMHMH
jgi:uncharacterized surface protein with fasciclin (FAS1) repeats